MRRIHVLSLTLDLCDLRGVYAFAEKLCRGRVSNPEGLEGEYLRNVRIPRLDTVIFNAAYGNWSGCNYPKAVWKILSEGLVQAVTYPTFKNSLPTSILNEQKSYGYVCFTFIPPHPFVGFGGEGEKRKYGLCANEEPIYSPRSPFLARCLPPVSLDTTSSPTSCSRCCLATQRPSPAAESSGHPA